MNGEVRPFRFMTLSCRGRSEGGGARSEGRRGKGGRRSGGAGEQRGRERGKVIKVINMIMVLRWLKGFFF
jgi:hypothetical protein